ncbi:hypothetical protein D6D00_09988 [Aureobasidium pullulans]|nr:hypothetical protein D6D00_09988 [Aureobasidium pullulans]
MRLSKMSPALVTSDHYQVAIVGGGIAGLTLALAFERLNISFVLFEARESITSDQGASIGLLPNGLRILEQLGVLEDIEKQTSPLKTWNHLDCNGDLIAAVDALGYYQESLGYGGLFLERTKVLQSMYDHLKAKDCVRTSARITLIENQDDHVMLQASDGSSITSDVVIGADGVRSCVRAHIDQSGDPKQKMRNTSCFTTRFACVYGISTALPGIYEGQCFSVYRKEASILIFTGKEGIVFWFVFEDLGEELPYEKTPRFKDDDIEATCQSVIHLKLTEEIEFGDIYARKTVATKIALEEGVAETWHHDRLVIVGDAAHKISKMVPNAAMGANQAMESSTVLVNKLQGVLKADGPVSGELLHKAISEYVEMRKPRTEAIKDKAAMVCRAQMCFDGPPTAMINELPSLTDGDWLFRGFAGLSGAPTIEGLAVTPRAKFYDQAIGRFWQKVKARGAGGVRGTNNDLFGLA